MSWACLVRLLMTLITGDTINMQIKLFVSLENSKKTSYVLIRHFKEKNWK